MTKEELVEFLTNNLKIELYIGKSPYSNSEDNNRVEVLVTLDGIFVSRDISYIQITKDDLYQ